MKEIQKKEIRDLVARNKELEEVISEIKTTLKTIKKTGSTKGQAQLRQTRTTNKKKSKKTKSWRPCGSKSVLRKGKSQIWTVSLTSPDQTGQQH